MSPPPALCFPINSQANDISDQAGHRNWQNGTGYRKGRTHTVCCGPCLSILFDSILFCLCLNKGCEYLKNLYSPPIHHPPTKKKGHHPARTTGERRTGVQELWEICVLFVLKGGYCPPPRRAYRAFPSRAFCCYSRPAASHTAASASCRTFILLPQKIIIHHTRLPLPW